MVVAAAMTDSAGLMRPVADGRFKEDGITDGITIFDGNILEDRNTELRLQWLLLGYEQQAKKVRSGIFVPFHAGVGL